MEPSAHTSVSCAEEMHGKRFDDVVDMNFFCQGRHTISPGAHPVFGVFSRKLLGYYAGRSYPASGFPLDKSHCTM